MSEHQAMLSEGLKALISPISTHLRARFEETKAERRGVEGRLLQDLRQYKGIYDPDVKIPAGRSKTFRRMTRTKVKAMNSRLMEMLFPANKDRNWDVEPTPRPDMLMTPLAKQMLQMRLTEAAQAQAAGHEVNIDPAQLAVEVAKAAAKDACDQMREEIDDQLKEVKHRKICRRVIHSGNLYGLGVLKAALTQEVVRNAWGMDDAGGWAQQQIKTLMPYEEDVTVWDFYPDKDARDLDECEVFHERHVMTRTALLDLAAQEGFDSEVIRQYAKDYINGDCQPEHWETDLDNMSRDTENNKGRTHNRYEVVEIWTSLTSAEMAEMGVDDEQLTDLNGESAWCCVWMLGPLVIKVDINPLPGRDHPYHAYYFDKDESSIWGEGIASIIRDDQIGLNATTRASLDNAASSAGAITEVDVQALAPGESSAIYPGRQFLARGTSKNTHGAIRVHQIQSRINEFMSLAGKFEDNIHEDTVPSYMHGDTAVRGAGKTASGLSMLMGAANVNIKDQVSHFDDGITRPVIEAYYHWNMVYNPRQEIKGDFTVKARGSSSLVAKEVRAQQLAEITDFVLHPSVAPLCDLRKFVEEVFKVRDMGGDDIVLSEEEAGRMQQLVQELEQAKGQIQQLQAVLEKLRQEAPVLFEQLSQAAAAQAQPQAA